MLAMLEMPEALMGAIIWLGLLALTYGWAFLQGRRSLERWLRTNAKDPVTQVSGPHLILGDYCYVVPEREWYYSCQSPSEVSNV